MNFIPQILGGFHRAALFLARAHIPFFLLPVLMVILVAGTVAQRSMGLYDAQRIFFSSPPVLVLMGLFTLSLLAKFIFKSEWRWSQAGIHLSHLGILILLIGGMMSAIQSREGMMIIAENDRSAIIQDYHNREFKISIKGNTPITIPFRDLHPGMVIPLPGLDGGQIKIINTHRHTNISRTEDPDTTRRGMAEFMTLSPARNQPDDEANINGLTMQLENIDPDIDGTYIAFDAMPKPVEAGPLAFILAKQHRPLPFEITLVDFHAERHPGTDMARSYRSDVIVKDGNITWPVRIEMNKPLRYRGYTFFQSAFFPPTQDNEAEATVLAVVENRAWLFPYLGTGIMAFGLLFHAILMARKRALP
jgi:hypothetical protein